ncbi:MAG: type I CRISPR-associated protein Cas7 [Peptococcaceae bacterium]|nr:type I CRISPR-associated protein Cas7 [Peptococcaceae bacterium]
MAILNGEILFVKAVKDGVPNRDPLNDSDARRIFGEDDGRISLSDVSIKRDVRDYVLAKYPDGNGKDGRYYVFCREERTVDGKLLGRDRLAEAILERAGRKDNPDKPGALLESAFDMRVFGAVFSVSKKSFHKTGPVQFGWAHSLHPVETKYVQGTVVMPSKDISDDGGVEGKEQGTIWTSYILPFAVFAMPGVINASIAEETQMDEDDQELLLEGLWKGTLHRQARGRGIQQPLLLLHVEYKDKFFRIGYLEDYLNLEPGRDIWLGGQPPTSLEEVTLDVTKLNELLGSNSPYRDKIAKVRWAKTTGLRIKGVLPGEEWKTW